jgi:homogentisate phytyltransferase/homogentisate geranylgeranyltransferase
MHFSMIDHVARTVESTSLRWSYCLVICWVFLRIFFEGILESHHYVGFSPFSYKMVLTYFVHFPLFYFCLFLILVILISLLIRENVRKVTKAASFGLVAITFVPVIDWLINRGYMITYPLRSGAYFLDFLNPFVSLANIGVSPGQRITIVLISFLISIYAFSKTRSHFRAALLFLVSLIVIIIFGGLTTLLAANRPETVFVPGSILYTDTQKYCVIYLLVFSVFVFVYLYMLSREFFTSILRSMRWERMTFYGMMAVFGLGISMVQKGIGFQTGIFDYLGIVTLFLSLAFAFWGLQVFNDIFDVDIDRVTGRRNPLLSRVTIGQYSAFFILLAILASVYALIINFSSFLILVAYLFLGIIYSLPPARLKRIPVISTMNIAVAVCLAIGLGFSVYYGGRALNAMPGKLIFPTLIAVTLGFSAKDIGHVDGDKAQGVVTLPVLLYDHRQLLRRMPMAVLVSVSYLVYAIFIPQLIPGALLCALATFLYSVFMEEPNETFYFVMLYLFGGYLFYVLTRLMPF